MIGDEAIRDIKQKKLNCLATKHLHVKSLGKLNRLNRTVDVLALAVPILFFVPRLLAKGTPYVRCVEAVWEVLAAFLLVAVVLKLVLRWEERAQIHSKLLAENIFLIGQSTDLLAAADRLSADSVSLFLRLAERSETADREAIGEVSEKRRQFAYREGLKELESGDVSIVCPICNSSPWRFGRGNCQLCGNTPTPTPVQTTPGF